MRVLMLLLCALAALTSCTSDDDEPTIPAGRWQIDGVAERSALRPSRGAATLNIDPDGTVDGSDGCGNNLKTRIEGDRLPYEGFHTLIGCVDDEANDEATLFWTVLEQRPTYRVSSRKLELETPAGDGLIFVPVEAP
jgi:heat shock protein HslJ